VGGVSVQIPMGGSSVLAGRRLCADSRQMCDGPELMIRAFEIDWARANQEPFRLSLEQDLAKAPPSSVAVARPVTLKATAEITVDITAENTADVTHEITPEIKPEITPEITPEMGEVKEELLYYFTELNAVYGYYCLTERQHDGFVLGKRGFVTLCEAAGLAEPVLRPHLDTIFSSSLQSGAATREQRMRDGLGLEDTLLRFEFMRAVVRIAALLYTTASPGCADLPSSISSLLTSMALSLPPDATEMLSEPDTFRRERLYTSSAAAVIERYAPHLRLIFLAYAAETDDTAGGAAATAHSAWGGGRSPPARSGRGIASAAAARHETMSALLSVHEWIELLVAAGMIYAGVGITQRDTSVYSASADLHPPDRDGLSADTAAILFSASRMQGTDEMRRRDGLTNLTFADFLEAVARLCAYKVLPTAQTIQVAGCTGASHFFEQAKAGALEPGVHPALQRNDEPFMVGRPLPTTPLGEALEVFLPWLLERFGFHVPNDGPPVPPTQLLRAPTVARGLG